MISAFVLKIASIATYGLVGWAVWISLVFEVVFIIRTISLVNQWKKGIPIQVGQSKGVLVMGVVMLIFQLVYCVLVCILAQDYHLGGVLIMAPIETILMAIGFLTFILAQGAKA